MIQNANFESALASARPSMRANIIELRQMANLYGTPNAILLSDERAGLDSLLNPPPYTHGEVIIRGNTIRIVDGLTDPIFAARGITVGGAKKVLVYDNIIDVPPFSPSNHMRDYTSGTVGYVNNRTAAGALVQGLGVLLAPPPGSSNIVPRTDLELEIDDAAMLSI